MKNNNQVRGDFAKRKAFISKVLVEILSVSEGRQLVFKGGTMMSFFLGCDRFSEDLDFSLINTETIRSTATGIYQKLEKLGYKLSDMHDDWTNVFNFEVLYDIDGREYNCQVELFKENYGIPIEFQGTFFIGKQISIMSREQSFAHKCCAYMERGSKKIPMSGRPKGRDLFDIDHYLKMGIIPDMKIITVRLGYKTIEELYLAIFKKLSMEHSAKHSEFALEMENFSNATINGLELINGLLRNIDAKFLGGHCRFNVRYKEEIDVISKNKKDGFVQVTRDIIVRYSPTDDFFQIVDLNTLKPILKAKDINKIYMTIKQYLENEYLHLK